MSLWEQMLKSFITEYRQHPKDFLRQPTISMTVHPNCNPLAVLYYEDMIKDPFFVTRILPRLTDSPVGRPFKFTQNQVPGFGQWRIKHSMCLVLNKNGVGSFKPATPQCSPLTIQHAYHLHLIKEHLGIFLPDDASHIVEIGGGYGNLCRLIKNFGYTKKYTIVDFPEMLEIQREYLSSVAVKDVEFSTLNMEQFAPKEKDISILVATFSVNEMPMKTRVSMEPHYNKYDYLFFSHNTAFDGIDNMKYFDDLKSQLQEEFDVTYFKDSHKTAWFMLCKKKGL